MIESPEDWWDLWIRSRADIFDIAKRVGINVDMIDQKHEPPSSLGTILNLAALDHCSKEVWSFCQLVWTRAPDAAVIHTWPGWANLCDLCSEYQAAFPHGEEDEGQDIDNPNVE